MPPDLLKQLVVMRDQECQMVGWSVPSWRGQVDHAVPFSAGGMTAERNHPLCLHHHRAKDGGGWKVVINADRSKTWTSPLGRSVLNPATRLLHPATSATSRILASMTALMTDSTDSAE